jgi:hypothetical protein
MNLNIAQTGAEYLWYNPECGLSEMYHSKTEGNFHKLLYYSFHSMRNNTDIPIAYKLIGTMRTNYFKRDALKRHKL